MRVEKIELHGLRFSSNRNYGGEGNIKILAEDIKRNGLINPITVKEITEEGATVFEVIAGRRRVKAFDYLKLKEIPCRVLEGEEVNHADEIAASENINRLSMHPLDEAKLFALLLENGHTREELAKRFARSVAEIYQRIQLLRLTENLKKAFYEERFSLESAAMLSTLEEDQQEVFFKKYYKTDNPDQEISFWDIKKFVSGLRHDKLYKFIADKDCAKCKTRTFYTDNNLFPDIDVNEDVCLNNECYIQKWKLLLSIRIKHAKVQSKAHAEAKIIACDDDSLYKIFGKTVVIDGVEYEVKHISYNNRTEKTAKKGYLPCFTISTEYKNDDDDDENVFVLEPRYYKEPEKQKNSVKKVTEKNPFEPLVKMAGLDGDEAKQTVATLTAKSKPKQSWETVDYCMNSTADKIERSVKEKVFNKLFEIKSKQPDNPGDVDIYLKFVLEDSDSKENLKAVVGTADIQELKKLSMPRLFTALSATTMDKYSIPDLDEINSAKESTMAKWAGVTMAKLKEMYLEELKLALPKPTAEKPKTPAAKGKGKK